eukprot:784089_1
MSTNQQMLSVVRRAIIKLYEGKREPNPLLSYQTTILAYFKQNAIDGDSFHQLNKNTFIHNLKQYILEKAHIESSETMKEAFGLLFQHIWFMMYEVPRRTPPTPRSTGSQMIRSFTPRVLVKDAVHKPPHTHSVTQFHFPPDYTDTPGVLTLDYSQHETELMDPLTVESQDSEENTQCDHGAKTNKEIIRNQPTMRKVQTEDIYGYTTRARRSKTRGLRVDVGLSNDFESQTPRFKRPKSAYKDVVDYLGMNLVYDDLILPPQNIPSIMTKCTHAQFLYIVSTVIDQINEDTKLNEDDTRLLYDKASILSYLYWCNLDGMSFQRSQPVFVQNIKQIVFHATNNDDFLTEREKEQYARALYQTIDSLPLHHLQISTQCRLSFDPSYPSYTNDPLLRKTSLSIISTLNQYQHCSYLMKQSDNRKVIDTLKDCNHKISSMLCSKWTVQMKNKEHAWDHTISKIADCSVLNIVFVFDCVLNQKLHKKSKRFLLLQTHAPVILQYLEANAIDGRDLLRWNQNGYGHSLNHFIESKYDLSEDIKALFQSVARKQRHTWAIWSRVKSILIANGHGWPRSGQEMFRSGQVYFTIKCTVMCVYKEHFWNINKCFK